MGSGKSVVGPRVAARLAWAFEDTDLAVERDRGQAVERIFREVGEVGFRRAERDVLRELSGRVETVVSTGGGLFLDRAARRLMKRTGATVWLDADLGTVRRRLGPGAGRPLWNGNDAIALRALYERRRVVYGLCDFRVDASSGTPDEVAGRVLHVVRSDYH
jgi:shikimate kinase